MSESFEYRLCGFGAALHMRLTSFEAPLPSSRVCSICGVVSRKVAILPCCHPICQNCFQVFVSNGNVCSLDEKKFEEKFVEWMEFSDEQLSKCPVFCWNVESGCDYLGSVMSLADHYHEDCAFHAVFCPRCKLPVLRSDVVKHRESDCDPVSTKDFSMEQGGPRVPGSIAVALAKLLHNNNQLQASVNMLAESVSSECSSLRESLIVQAAKSNETSSCLSDCHKKLVEILNESKGCVNGCLSKEIYLYSNTASDSAAGGTKEVPSTNCLFQLHWYLENWGYLKTEAEIAKNGMPRVESTAAYMHGYNTVCVAAVDKLETEHYFLCSLKLVKGEHDSVLEWPFRKTCKISVIHPEDPSKTLSATIDDRKYKEKGLHPPGEKYGFPIRTAFITPVHVIENGGYATNGPLHLCLEILP